MRNSWAGKWLVGAAALVVLIGIVLHFSNRSPPPITNTPPAVSQKPESAPSKTFSSRSQPATPAEESPTQADDQLAQILALKLPREKIEEYLTLHHRDAASLLAAFHASGDTNNPTGDINYLKEAATNFPNDPHVQWTVLAHYTSPEDRREWLDAFKESSPSNSMANYLSARDYFENNQPDAAVNELLAATSKSQFKDHSMETLLGEEDLYRSAGKTPLEANRAAMSALGGIIMPELATLKSVAISVRDMQKRYVAAGDAASSENLSQMTVALANRLSGDESGKVIINQLVGIAVQSIALQNLDQDASYDFLGGKTPAQRKEELKQQRAAIKELNRSFQSIQPTMTETETVGYYERLKIYGEVEAMRWVQRQHKPDAPSKGN